MRITFKFISPFFLIFFITSLAQSKDQLLAPILTNTKIQETNFQSIILKEYPVSKISGKIILATDSKDIIFAADRDVNEISIIHYDENNNNLIQHKVIKIPNLLDKKLTKTYILDMHYSDENLYISLIHWSDNPNLCSRVELYESDKNLNKFKSIYNSYPCMSRINFHDIGGRIASNEKNLFMSGGNVFVDTTHTSYPYAISPDCCKKKYRDQIKETNLFGSIIQISKTNLKTKKIAQGIRSPGGLFWDPIRKKLWETEHGPRGGDELNIIESNKNYGWPFVSLGKNYAKNDMGNLGTKFNTQVGFEAPFYAWMPSVGPSQLTSLDKNSVFWPEWKNDLIISSLKDQSIYRIKIDDNRFIYAERIFVGRRLRDIEKLKNALALGTDSGSILIIRPSKEISAGPFPLSGL
jgi:hypothetical protein